MILFFLFQIRITQPTMVTLVLTRECLMSGQALFSIFSQMRAFPDWEYSNHMKSCVRADRTIRATGLRYRIRDKPADRACGLGLPFLDRSSI